MDTIQHTSTMGASSTPIQTAVYVYWIHFNSKRFRRGWTNITLSTQILIAEFTKQMTTHAPKLHNHDTNIIKQLQPGHIHTLCLQLALSGIVEVIVNDHTLFGSDNLLKTNLKVKSGKDKDGTLKALSPIAFEDFQTWRRKEEASKRKRLRTK